MTGKLGLFLCALCVLGLVAVWLMLYSTPFGIGIWLDSLHYVSAAESLMDGLGFGRVSGCGSFKPMTHYPPFYSLTLAAFSPLGLSPIRAARVVSALCYGLTVTLSGLAIYKIDKNRLLALLGAGLMLISPIVLKTFSWALSEPLFIPLFLASFLVLSLYFEKPLPTYLLVAGGLLGMAFLTRYVGIAFIVSAEILLFLDHRINLKPKLRDMTLLGVLSIGPVILWLIRNFIWMRTVADRNLDWHPPETEAWVSLSSTILGWFLPKTWTAGWEISWLIGFMIIGTFCLVAWVYISWRQGKLSWKVPSLELLFVASIIVYMVLLGISLTFFDPNTVLNDRILIPVYILLIILLISQAGRAIQSRQRIPKALVLICLGLFLVWQIHGGYLMIRDLRKDGQGYASSVWRSALIVKELKELRSSLVYSNDITAVYFLAGTPACSIPSRGDQKALTVMRDKLEQENAVLAIFGRKVSGEFMPYEEIISGLLPIYEQSDGVILTKPGTP
jgi:4-amino-4-deoxy-L-arabinose transferase-like glycosyltransferase